MSTVVNKQKGAASTKPGARNIVEKIWDSHVVSQQQGHPAIFAVDLMLLHEVTSAQAFQEIEKRGIEVSWARPSPFPLVTPFDFQSAERFL